MSSDDSDAPARFDPRFDAAFQRGSSSGGPATRPGAFVQTAVPFPRSAPRGVESGTDALEAAFARTAPPADPVRRNSVRNDPEPFETGPVDEGAALDFVRRCAFGSLGLVVALLLGSVVWQAIAPTGVARQWVYFLSQFVFIAAPGLFVFGIVALVFVGYRRRLIRSAPEDHSEGTPLP